MKQSTPTLCSLSLCFWGYQTGAWMLAIPMALAIEARELVKQRWSLSLDHLRLLHVTAPFVWLLAIFFLPLTSPEAIPYAARYHLIKCLPIGLFPFVLAQTYCVNFSSVYRQYLGNLAKSWKTVSWYYPYFGICLVASSATGGNLVVFLAVSAVLIALFLGTIRWPVNRKLSLRFSQSTFYGLIVLALVLSLIGTHQFYWLQANVRVPGPAVFGDFIQKMARIWPDDPGRGYAEDLDRLLENMELEPETGKIISTKSDNQHSSTAGSTDTPSNTDSPSYANGNSSTSSPPPNNSGDDSSNPSSNPSTADGSTQEETDETDEGSFSTPDPEPDVDISQPNEDPSNPDISEPSPEQHIETPPPPNGSAPSSTRGQDRKNPGQTKAPKPRREGGQFLPSLVQRSGGIVDPEQAQTQVGNIGSLQLSNTILFRVAPQTNRPQPQFPLYIREATYNQYQSGSWKAVKSQFKTKRPQPNRQSWRFVAKTGRTTSVRILSDLPRQEGILKLPLGTSEVSQLQVKTLQENQYGTVAIQGKLGPLAYTVQFDPRHSLDSPPTPFDKAVPAVEKPTLKRILKSLDLNGKSDADKVEAISAFYKTQGFKYSLDLPKPKRDKTPMAAFLLDHRSGHCEYYASATSLLLRAAGVPTRYAVGYTAHEYSPTAQQYIVRLKDAHAWVLAYVDNTWVKVETTPGGGITPERNVAHNSNAQEGNDQAGTSFPDGVTTQEGSTSEAGNPSQDGTSSDNSSLTGENNNPPSKSLFEKLSEAWAALMDLLSKHSETLVWAGSMIVLGLVIVLGSIYLMWKALRKQRVQRAREQRRQGAKHIRKSTDGLDSEFYQIEQRLADWGLARLPSETIRKWLGRLEQELPDASMQELHQIIDLHYRYRFDPQGLTDKERETLKSMIQSWLGEFIHRSAQGSRSAINQ